MYHNKNNARELERFKTLTGPVASETSSYMIYMYIGSALGNAFVKSHQVSRKYRKYVNNNNKDSKKPIEVVSRIIYLKIN